MMVNIYDKGTRIEALSAVIENYGLDSQMINIRDNKNALNNLNEGDMAIFWVTGENQTNKYLDGNGSGGHYIVGYMSDQEGMINILDPNNPANNGLVDIDTLAQIGKTKLGVNAVLVSNN